jgi:hypothetical protein
MQLTINRVAAALVAVAMIAGLVFAFTATRAQALTLSELVELFIALEVIPADKADEARSVLEGQDEDDSSSSSSMACEFTRDLSTGSTGADVMDLQKLLNSNGFTVAASGVGSPGMETDYYGSLTAGAVAAMQEAFASEILAPLGLTAGTGYFGASTRAKANSLCGDADMPDMPDLPDMDEDEDEDEPDTSGLSGEASLDVFEINTADDDELEEGAEDAVIAEVTMEFTDGDALVKRVDVQLEADSGNGEMDPWDVFESISLWVDGDKIDEKDADDKNDYLGDESDGILRFSGLDIIGMEDEEVDMLIAATLMSNLDDMPETWEVSVDEIRYEDADEVTTTDSGTDELGDAVAFTIDEEGTEDELIVKSNSSDPDSSIIKVEDDSKSDWVTIFVFDLDTDDSVNDILLDMVPVSITVGTATYDTLVNDARLVIDGTTIDSSDGDLNENYGGTSTTAIMEFDVNEEVEIDAGDRVEAELQLRFEALDPAYEGATVEAAVTSANADAIEAEGADDLSASSPDQLRGSATGEQHQLFTEGIFAEIVSTDIDTKSNGTVDDSVGEFEIKFDLTAFEDTYYVSASSTSVFDVDILNNDGSVASATPDFAVDSTANEDNDAYELNEGDTETFTITINHEPGVAGFYSAILKTVDFGSSETAISDQELHNCAPAEDFETDKIYINA